MFEVQDDDSKVICTPNAIPVKWPGKLCETVEFVSVLLIPFGLMLVLFSCDRIMWGKTPLVAADNLVYIQHSFAASNADCWFGCNSCHRVLASTFIMSFVRIVSGTDRVHRGELLHEFAMFDTFINGATVEFRFFEYSIIRNSRFFEPKVVSLGFASVKHCNFTPDFSNARLFETPDISTFLSKIYIRFSRTLKTQEPTKTGFSHIHTGMQLKSSGEGVFTHFLLQSR